MQASRTSRMLIRTSDELLPLLTTQYSRPITPRPDSLQSCRVCLSIALLFATVDTGTLTLPLTRFQSDSACDHPACEYLFPFTACFTNAELSLATQAVIIGFSRFLALFLQRIRQPRVIAEVLGGIILGPTAFGRIPGFTEHIFPPVSYVLFFLHD